MSKTIEKLEKLFEKTTRYSNCYWWKPATNAYGRRQEEQRGSIDHFEWEEGGHKYSAEFSVKCSCKNIYAKGYYKKDGRFTNLTAIKNSYKRLLALEEPKEESMATV